MEGQATAVGGRGWEATVLPRVGGGGGHLLAFRGMAPPQGLIPEQFCAPPELWRYCQCEAALTPQTGARSRVSGMEGGYSKRRGALALGKPGHPA